MPSKPLRLALAAAILLLMAASGVPAQETQGNPGQSIQWVQGPTTAALGDGLAEIRVPEGYLFADAAETKKVMQMTGNPPSGEEIGLIAPAEEGKSWFLVFEHKDVGYVKDDEKDKIDADAILDSIREGNEAANEERKKMKADTVEVVGWFEAPHYDSATHNLIWAIEGKSGNSALVNYDVRLLGRNGYVSATLVTDPQALTADLPHLQTLLGGFSYKEGNRYAEWKPGDKVAEYGLAALVAGGAGAAALKMGLFAKLAKLLAKGWKLVVVAFAGLTGWVKKMLGGKKQEGEDPTAIAP